MKDFLMQLLIIIILPFALVFALWDGIIEFIKAVIKGIKDWSDLL